MYSDYFNDWDIKPNFKQEFICIFDGWLGEEKFYKLDMVTEKEWSSFNIFIKLIFNKYQLYIAEHENESCKKVKDVDSILSTFEETMNKEPSQFTMLIIPELNCAITEDWDYTYILWHKNNGAVENLAPLMKQAGLYHFKNKGE